MISWRSRARRLLLAYMLERWPLHVCHIKITFSEIQDDHTIFDLYFSEVTLVYSTAVCSRCLGLRPGRRTARREGWFLCGSSVYNDCHEERRTAQRVRWPVDHPLQVTGTVCRVLMQVGNSACQPLAGCWSSCHAPTASLDILGLSLQSRLDPLIICQGSDGAQQVGACLAPRRGHCLPCLPRTREELTPGC